MMQTTDQLIARLVGSAQPVLQSRVSIRLAVAGAAAVFAALLLQMLTVGVRADVNLAYGAIVAKWAALTLVALTWGWLLRQLASPGTSRRLQQRLALSFAVLAVALASFGQSTITGIVSCVQQVTLLALPAFVLFSIVLRRSAPTELVKTGFVAGVVAGLFGVLGYSLGCTADDPNVVALRYGIAVLICGVIGAAAGRWVLRW